MQPCAPWVNQVSGLPPATGSRSLMRLGKSGFEFNGRANATAPAMPWPRAAWARVVWKSELTMSGPLNAARCTGAKGMSPVELCRPPAASADAEVFEDPPDLVDVQMPRLVVGLLTVIGVRVARRRRRRGGDRSFAAKEARVDDAPDMPRLGKNPVASLVNAVLDPAPTGDLFGRPQADGVGPTKPLLGDPDRLGNHQAGAGPFCVVGFHHLGGGRAPASRGRVS